MNRVVRLQCRYDPYKREKEGSSGRKSLDGAAVLIKLQLVWSQSPVKPKTPIRMVSHVARLAYLSIPASDSHQLRAAWAQTRL